MYRSETMTPDMTTSPTTNGTTSKTEGPTSTLNDSDAFLLDNASTTTSASASSPATTQDGSESSPPSLTRLLAVSKPEWAALVLALIVMVASEAITLISPIIIARAYDALVDPSLTSEDDRLDEINQAMLLVIILHISGSVAAFIRHALMGVVGERLVARLRNQLYASILKQEIAFFDEH